MINTERAAEIITVLGYLIVIINSLLLTFWPFSRLDTQSITALASFAVMLLIGSIIMLLGSRIVTELK